MADSSFVLSQLSNKHVENQHRPRIPHCTFEWCG